MKHVRKMTDKQKIKIYLEISIVFHDPVIKRQLMFPRSSINFAKPWQTFSRTIE